LKFCLNADFHVTFRDLLHAVKLRHGTDGFTSPPKRILRIFFALKIPTTSAGCEPANLGTKGQHATSRPPNFGTKGQHATSRPPNFGTKGQHATSRPPNLGTKGQHATSRPPNLGTKGQHATSRPPKLLYVYGLMEELQIQHHPERWRLFFDLSKVSLKN